MNDMAQAVLRLLDENKIDYTLAEHPAVFNMEELYAQGLEHCDAIAKNLLVRDQKKCFYWLLVLYGEKRADLKALKARLGHGALSFAGAEELGTLLGLTPGSVTPFGALNDAEHRVTVLLDEDYRGKLIGVHPCDTPPRCSCPPTGWRSCCGSRARRWSLSRSEQNKKQPLCRF